MIQKLQLKELNKDQLAKLADLCFDFGRAAFLFLFLPSQPSGSIVIDLFLKSITSFWGLAFIYIGLLLLKLKVRVKS